MRLLDRYEQVVGHQEVERLRRLADRLRGKRIVHVNSTRTGGGVAEILGWMVPLMQELDLQARWEVIAGPPDFYRVTKAFHNGLQGKPVTLRRKDFDLHYEVNKDNAKRLNLEADVVFVHDPQPA
jgi:trehalose synthase